jgi:hypothetical protein
MIMRYFSREATFTYLTLTEVSYDNYLTSDHDYFDRLHILRQFCDPDDRDSISNIDIHISDFREWHGDFHQNEFYYPEDRETKPNSSLSGNGENTTSPEGFQGDDFDPIVHFITNNAGKISNWEFHKTDSDFFPSIPHGHAIINHKIKLDAFRGHIFKNNQHFGRETRQYIIDLWNDDKFRDAARQTIVYYMNTYPNYNWRVTSPLRLPRRRR